MTTSRTLPRAVSLVGQLCGPLCGPLLAALVAVVASSFVPMVSALMWALVIGVGVANLAPGGDAVGDLVIEWSERAKTMLRLGIVLLGLQLSLSAVASLGLVGLVIIVSTVVVTFASTSWLGHRIGVEPELVTLVAAGFSICGAAAIAAVQDATGARQRHVGAAVALVTIFGTVVLFTLPWAAGLLDLSDTEAAVWAGASIHEVAQVVAASSLIGASALPVASAIKLGRVVLLAPVTALVTHRHGRPDAPLVPWFVAGFVVACLVGTTGVVPTVVAGLAAKTAALLLAAGMFGLGLGLTGRELLAVPGRAIVLAVLATMVALVVPLALILLLL